MIIAIDFDGTCVTHDFPSVGKEIGAAPVLKKLVSAGHELILFTMRSNTPVGDVGEIHMPSRLYLTDAIRWFGSHGIPLYGIQCNPTQHTWTSSPKCYAQLYIDDAALGIPLIENDHARPYVDWVAVEKMLVEKRII